MGYERADYRTDYEAVGAGATDQVLGPVGAVGDVLDRIVATCTGAAVTNTVSIKDGNGASIPLVPTNAAAGVYSILIGARAANATTPGWKVTTAATVTVLAVGKFT